MAHFQTHSEGGSWVGGGHDVPNCSDAEQAMINAALADIQSKLDGCTLNGLDELKQHMQDLIDCALELNCSSGSDCDGLDGYESGGTTTLCNPTSQTQARLNAILFHEMVHACGGTELDSEALENHCYAGNGATSPTSDDFPKFDSDGGEFVIWDKETGEVFVKVRTGGSWIEPPTISKGDRLTPVFTPPPAGGGGSWI